MKRGSMLLLAAMICMICLPALASVEDMPVALSAMFEEQNSGVSATDYVEFTTPDGVRHAFILDGWGMTGYQYRDGAWQNVRSGSVLYSGSGPRFRRHDTQAVRADGSTYPDDLDSTSLGMRTACASPTTTTARLLRSADGWTHRSTMAL